MNAKLSVFVICAESNIYLLLYNLPDCTFNVKYEFVHLQLFEVKFLFSEKKRTAVYGLASLV